MRPSLIIANPRKRASPSRLSFRWLRQSLPLKKNPLRSSKLRNLRLSLKLLPLLQMLKRLRLKLSMARAVAEAVVAEVAVAGEVTVKAVAVAAEAVDLDRTAKTLMASSRRLVRSLFVVAEATGVANGAVKVVVAVVTVVVTVAVTAETSVQDHVIAPEVELALRMKVLPSPLRRPPMLNPLNRFE